MQVALPPLPDSHFLQLQNKTLYGLLLVLNELMFIRHMAQGQATGGD